MNDEIRALLAEVESALAYAISLRREISGQPRPIDRTVTTHEFAVASYLAGAWLGLEKADCDLLDRVRNVCASMS